MNIWPTSVLEHNYPKYLEEPWNMNEVWEAWRRSCSVKVDRRETDLSESTRCTVPVKPRPGMGPIAEYPPSKATATQFGIIDKELERDLLRIWVCPELLYDTEGNLIGMETLEADPKLDDWTYIDYPPKELFRRRTNT